MKILNQLKHEILSSNNTAIVCHKNPDGDTLGSAFALSGALDKMNKKNDILCDDTLPHRYHFMNDKSLLNEYNSDKYDLVIFVDCAALALTGSLFEGTDISALNTVCIDHHGTNEKFAKINYVDDSFSSAAEMILGLIKELGVEVDKTIAEYIYIGMVTDTGRFSYSYTSERTHQNAGFLLKCGVNFSNLNKMLFATTTFSKLMLTKQMLINLKLSEEGRVGFSMLTQRDFEESGAAPEETDSLVNTMLSIEDVKIAVLVRQTDDSAFKASFRSDDDTDISKAAKLLGGGGHKQASGATLRCTESEVEDIIANAIKKAELLK